MANFIIGIKDRKNTVQNGYVQLTFFSDVPQKLIIKDICFLPKHVGNNHTIIIPVYITDGEKTQTIKFPDKAVYNKLEFLLKQEGEKGWKVSVDLDTDAIPIIEEVPFQVL